MTCPNCQSSTMTLTKLEDNLEAQHCSSCQGTWIPSRNYFRFMDGSRPDLNHMDKIDFQKVFSPKDSTNKKICPDCGKPITSRKAGFGANFLVERCEHCFGIWLDEKEWELLKSKKLHNAIYYFFSSSWQSRVKTQSEIDQRLSSIRSTLNNEQSVKVSEFLMWLETQENKDEIKAYLL
jgi:Zn-finger nucleic acid-binding protein